MSNPATAPALNSDAPAETLPAEARERRRLAVRILADALFLGSLGDALLHDGFGIGLFVLALAFSGTFLYAVRHRGGRLTREQWAWLGAALFFAAAFAWRDSGELLFYDFSAMLAALALLGATVSEASPMRTILGKHCRDLLFMARRTVANGLAGVTRALGETGVGEAPRSLRSNSRAMRVLRASLLAVPVVVVFGILFASADPLFLSIFSIPQIDLGTVLSHVVLAGVITWIVAGWLQGALGDRDVRAVPAARFRISLGALEVTTILGSLLGLFTLFVGVQIGWLFGGERLVRSTTGLGYAQYARHGFFELVFVALLVLPVLLGTRAALDDGDGVAIRRHRMLSVPLLVLLAGVMASTFGRMMLYVHYYGLSTDRFFASVFMAWLAIVFTWLGLTTLRARGRDFAAGMVITGFVTLGAVNIVNPEALIARVNVARGPTALRVADSARVRPNTPDSSIVASPVDYAYLTSLGTDAIGVVVPALIAPPVSPAGTRARIAEVRERCDAVRSVLNRWGAAAGRLDWRRWNVSLGRARRVVAEREGALRAVTCWDAGVETPFGDRAGRTPQPGEQWYMAPRK